MDNNNYHSINNSDNNNMRPITELDSDTTDFKSPELNKKFNSAQSFFKENKNDPSKPLLRRTDDVDDEGGYSFCCCTPFSETFRIFVLIFRSILFLPLLIVMSWGAELASFKSKYDIPPTSNLILSSVKLIKVLASSL